jgi:hypothetical protein
VDLAHGIHATGEKKTNVPGWLGVILKKGVGVQNEERLVEQGQGERALLSRGRLEGDQLTGISGTEREVIKENIELRVKGDNRRWTGE